jgi:hypothetical protein
MAQDLSIAIPVLLIVLGVIAVAAIAGTLIDKSAEKEDHR